MKEVLTAAAAFIGIIVVQIILSHVYSYQIAEVFSKTATTALFFYYVIKSTRKQKTA